MAKQPPREFKIIQPSEISQVPEAIPFIFNGAELSQANASTAQTLDTSNKINTRGLRKSAQGDNSKVGRTLS
jgi:hypothetical protein